MQRPAVDRLLCLALFLGGFFLLSAASAPDANWDLRNYHLYNPFALLNDRFGHDIAPAQRQTFLAPQLDLIWYWLRIRLNDRPALLGGILSVPHAVGAFLTYLIALRFIPKGTFGRPVLGLLAATIGATGAGALPTLGTSLSEMIPVSFCLAGLLLLLRMADGRGAVRQAGLAGLSFGMAAALKLTVAPFCVGAGVALLVAPVAPLRQRLRAAVAFGLTGAASLLVVAGPWCLFLYARYGSPLFPFYNNIFRSRFFAPVSLTDDRFLPPGALHAIFYPFFWAVDWHGRVTELDMRDPRLAVAFVAMTAAAAWVVLARARSDARIALFAVFYFVSYALWEMAFSIYRYVVPLEFLAPVALLAALQAVAAGRPWHWARWVAMLALGALCWRLTVYPDWGRAPRDGPAVHVVVPALPDDALVVLLDGSPMAYVAVFAPPGVRFVGANNNLIGLGQDSALARQVQAAIRDAKGPIWGLEDSTAPAQTADATLKFYGLHRAQGCVMVVSNLDANALRLCPLSRDP